MPGEAARAISKGRNSGRSTTIILWTIFLVLFAVYAGNFIAPTPYLDNIIASTPTLDTSTEKTKPDPNPPLPSQNNAVISNTPITESTDGPKPPKIDDEDKVLGKDKDDLTGKTETEDTTKPDDQEAQPEPTFDRAKADYKALKEFHKRKLLKTLAKRPSGGTVVNITYKDGKKATGKVAVWSSGFVSLIEPELLIRPEEVNEETLKLLWPEQYASLIGADLARDEIKRRHKETPPKNLTTRHKAPEIPQNPETDFEKDRPKKSPEFFDIPVSGGLKKLTKYDISYSKSPVALKGPIQDFQNWIGIQQRRQGIPIVSKMWAKQYSNAVVLHMEVSDMFMRAKKNWRAQVTDSFRRIWFDKLSEHKKLNSSNMAHLVLVNKNRIVGGTKVNNTRNSWVK